MRGMDGEDKNHISSIAIGMFDGDISIETNYAKSETIWWS